MRAYREGHTPGPALEEAFKKYKSHRCVSTTEQL